MCRHAGADTTRSHTHQRTTSSSRLQSLIVLLTSSSHSFVFSFASSPTQGLLHSLLEMCAPNPSDPVPTLECTAGDKLLYVPTTYTPNCDATAIALSLALQEWSRGDYGNVFACDGGKHDCVIMLEPLSLHQSTGGPSAESF